MSLLWEITWVDSAEKDFLRLSQKEQTRVSKHFKMLLLNPFYGSHIKKLHGELKGLYRYRVGDLRIIYRILNKEKIIRIIAIDTRGNIY